MQYLKLASGHGAYLLEQNTEDVFVVNIGNLPPGKEVLIKLQYVQELELEHDECKCFSHIF